MRYMGSKRRIANEILPIILKTRKSEDQYYVEPFCGGCNLIDKVSGKRIAADNNEYLMAMWVALQQGWFPEPYYTEEQYHEVKSNKDREKHLTGYFGFALSFGGKFFGGWSRDKQGSDYPLRAHRNMTKQFPLIKDVEFQCGNYDEIVIPPDSIIYCDIPYRDTTKYHSKFGYENFYEWCRQKKADGHEIFISEYQMPEDFVCVWEGKLNGRLAHTNESKVSTEKLFTLL